MWVQSVRTQYYVTDKITGAMEDMKLKAMMLRLKSVSCCRSAHRAMHACNHGWSGGSPQICALLSGEKSNKRHFNSYYVNESSWKIVLCSVAPTPPPPKKHVAGYVHRPCYCFAETSETALSMGSQLLSKHNSSGTGIGLCWLFTVRYITAVRYDIRWYMGCQRAVTTSFNTKLCYLSSGDLDTTTVK